jgi:hypothetical protein
MGQSAKLMWMPQSRAASDIFKEPMKISIAKPPQFEFFTARGVKTLTEMSELCLDHNFSPAIFKGGKRSLANFEIAYCIGLDIDNDGKMKPGGKVATPLMTIEEAKEAFKDYTHLILPSRSHQKDKPGEGIRDRFRVILFFSEPITDLDTFYATWHWCHEKWPAIDHQCKDPSRGYFAHSAVASVRGGGLRITPVLPAPKEPKADPVDVFSLPPGSRGKLSKATLQLLSTGPEKGNRNGDTYKAAKDFQQNLYTLEEASEQIVASLHQNGTIARDFTEQEVLQTIRSAFNKDAKHDPRIRQRAFNLVPIGELYKTNSKVEWLVENLLTTGGVSLMSSDPKAGKSTLVRQLMREILRGTTFLGRQCKQGVVHYYGIEEQLEVVNASFKRLGVMTSEPLFVHVGDSLSESKLEDFREILMETKPALAVIDTLFDFLDVESENNYKEVKRELRKLRQIARESGTHILLVHHNSKGQKDDRRRGNRGILGSQAIAGGVDTIMVIEVEGNTRMITSSGREIKRWNNRELVFNFDDCTYSLGPETDDF